MNIFLKISDQMKYGKAIAFVFALFNIVFATKRFAPEYLLESMVASVLILVFASIAYYFEKRSEWLSKTVTKTKRTALIVTISSLLVCIGIYFFTDIIYSSIVFSSILFAQILIYLSNMAYRKYEGNKSYKMLFRRMSIANAVLYLFFAIICSTISMDILTVSLGVILYILLIPMLVVYAQEKFIDSRLRGIGYE